MMFNIEKNYCQFSLLASKNKQKSLLSHYLPTTVNPINEKSQWRCSEDNKQCARLQCSYKPQSYDSDTWLVIKLRDAEHDRGMKAETLEPDLFKQNIQMSVWSEIKSVKHRCITVYS